MLATCNGCHFAEPSSPFLQHVFRVQQNVTPPPPPLPCAERPGYEWHTDNVGPSHTSLYCRSALDEGGETLFCSARRMYELLTDAKRYAALPAVYGS